MKQILLLLSALTVAIAAQALPPRTAGYFDNESQQWPGQARKSPRHAEADGIWKPGTASIYNWDSETNDWRLDRTVIYTYNDLGQETKVEGAGYTEILEYAPTGQVSSYTIIYPEGGSVKTSYTYDEVTDAPTGYTICELEYDQWVTTAGCESRIARNEKGNITRIDEYSYRTETGEMKPTAFYVYNYGDDDKINEIIDCVIWGDDLNDGSVYLHLNDIVWENTYNQPIFSHSYVNSLSPMFPSNLCNNDNRIKSCTIDDYIGKGATADMKVEYTDNLGSYKGLISVYGTPIHIHEYSFIDENGSYTDYEEHTDYSVNGSTITTGDTYVVYKAVVKFDSYGRPIEYGYETPDYKYKTTCDVTYDPTYGYPTEEITMSAANDEEMQKQSRTVYGDYALYAGAVSPEVDADAPVEYYNLQGIRVTNPSNGIYIRRQGKDISKVLVK